MALRRINAILWRRYYTSTSDALFGKNTSQYYIELPKGGGNYAEFVNGGGTWFKDPQDNDCVKFEIAELDGSDLEKYEMTLKVLAAGKQRGGNTIIYDQSPAKAYPLWRPKRGPLRLYDKHIDGPAPQYAVIVRDIHNSFHARWIRHEDFLALPHEIRDLLDAKDAGWDHL